MDTYAFASLAHLRILLVPVGLIPQTTFETYSAEIRNYESLRLGEIPADAKDGRAARFLPNPMSTGNIQLSFPTHPPPRSHSALSLLRPSHFPLAVIGIAACSQSESLTSLTEQFESSLTDVFPSSGLYPLVKNCWAFETTEGSANLDAGATAPRLTVVPNIANRKLHIGTLLGGLCSQMLAGFGVLVEALENPLGNEYLNASIMPSLPPLSELPSSLDSLAGGDGLQNMGSFNSSPDISRASFSLGPVPNLKRNTSFATTANSRQGSLGVQAQKKRMSTIGTSSSHGRLYKMLGDFFLLSGRVEDAMLWYNEAILLFKTTHDPLWFACTLEGIATVAIVEAWATGHGLNHSIANAKEPWVEVNEKLQQAIALYTKVAAPENESTHSLLVMLYCECVLRQTSLLFTVWSSKGWGPLAFSALLEPGPKPHIPPTLSGGNSDSWLLLERLSHITGISRSSIAASLAQIHGPWLLHLGQRERISILEATASVYACIGYRRKEAYILREVLGCILDLIVCGREEDGVSQASGILPTAGLAIQNVQSNQGPAWGALGVRLSESDAGNAGVLKLLKYICKVLGIDLEAVGLLEGTNTTATQRNLSLEEYDEDIVEELREPYGWPEIQVGVVREASAVAEALPDFPAVAQFALSSLKTLQHILSPSDQYHLYSSANRALITARRRGDARTVEYWSGKPVVSIAIAPLPANRIPLEKPRSIQHSAKDLKPLVIGMTDPFLYNPRRVINKGQTIIVQNEAIELVVTLQNPYIFDLELEEITLSTSGASFQSEPTRITIPANSLHQSILTGRATSTGTLIIRGCFVKAIGSSLREYVLPLYTTGEEERVSRKRRAISAEMGRVKYTGLDRYIRTRTKKQPSSRVSNDATGVTPFKFMECKVIPEQPLLRIRRSSVTHGALMLYEGEKSTIRLTLENVSSISVDFLHAAFEDSTIEPAQKALADGNLSVFDTYETENNLINKPVFSRDQVESQDIAPSQSLTVSFSCFGKVGCTNGTIHVSYAENSNLNDPDVFYVRQISYPLMVTVYHMLECSGMDILQLPSYPLSDRRSHYNNKNDRLNALNFEERTGWCLFSIEVRNTYGSPFDVALIRTQDGQSTTSPSTTIPPGSVSRLVIPIKKILLSNEEIARPIPTLSDRQFVVTVSNLSKDEERIQRELFWYREALLQCIQGRWHETGGIRSGELSFREQRMTSHMLECFRLEVASVSLSLESLTETPNDLIKNSGLRYYPQANDFVQLRATIKNLTPFPIVFMADVSVSPAEHVVHEGVMSNLPVGRLESGASKDIKMSLCFLTFGHFELSIQVRSFGETESRMARSHITAVVADSA